MFKGTGKHSKEVEESLFLKGKSTNIKKGVGSCLNGSLYDILWKSIHLDVHSC